ncbi:MAG TPA: hypothetical protein VNW89_17085 [Stellaceae bacterium]|jgi:hypothetical protein|nr:hypothetical protein [Stellaceae bacterium]
MEYIGETGRERAQWMSLGEVEAFVIGTFQTADARQQIRAALGDGMLSLRWDNSPGGPAREVGGASIGEGLPSRRHKRWQDARINWVTGEVFDDFDLTPEATAEGQAKWRRLLIHRISVRAVWSPPADKYQDPDLYEEQSALRLRRVREEREEKQAAAEAAWAAEHDKPMRQRQFFGFDEIADALARIPGRFEIDAAERECILLDLEKWLRGENSISPATPMW